MEKSNKIILFVSILATMSFVITYLSALLFQEPTMLSIVQLSKQKMNEVSDIIINYRVEFLGLINGTEYNETGASTYVKENNVVSWSNNITFLGTSLFNLRPETLLDMLEVRNGEDYRGQITGPVQCHFIGAVVLVGITETIETLLGGYDYIKIDSCLNMSNGYPISYTMLITKDNNVGIITYSSTSDIAWA